MRHKEYPLIMNSVSSRSYTDHGKKMIEIFEIMISTHDKRKNDIQKTMILDVIVKIRKKKLKRA